MEKRTILLIGLCIVVVMNLVAFAFMGIDKRRARRGAWRVSEKSLFLATACFGGLGGVLGMRVFHHKTKHWYFKVFFPALLVAQIALLGVGAYWLLK